MVEVGGSVTFVDRVGTPRAALVTAVWGSPESHPAINVVLVSDDVAKADNYGRQIERETSVPHESMQTAHGYFWR